MTLHADRAWEELTVDTELGLECESYKWQQNQSFVEVYVHVPQGTTVRQVYSLIFSTAQDL